MGVESSRNAKDIFLAALEVEPLDKRDAFVAAACGNDQSLRQRVAALLNAHQCPGSLLDHPPIPHEVASTGDVTTSSEIPSSYIGPYKLREQIGEGGMGTVFVAEQEKPLRRKVALKVIKPGMDTKPLDLASCVVLELMAKTKTIPRIQSRCSRVS